MTIDPQLVADAATVALGVVLVLSLLKPLLDTLGVVSAMPDTAYNAFYQVLGFALNFAGLVLYEAAFNRLRNVGPVWFFYAVAAFVQQMGSHTVYTKIKGAVLNNSRSALASAVASAASLAPLAAFAGPDASDPVTGVNREPPSPEPPTMTVPIVPPSTPPAAPATVASVASVASVTPDPSTTAPAATLTITTSGTPPVAPAAPVVSAQ